MKKTYAKQAVKNGKDNPSIKAALEVVSLNNSEKSKVDNADKMALDLAEEAFEVSEVKAPRLTESFKPYQAFWKAFGRVKCHDFTIHGTGSPSHEEQAVTQGIMTVLTRSYFLRELLGKGGILASALALGDGFFTFTTSITGFPFKVISIPKSNVYIDTQATGIRSGANPVNKLVFMLQMPTGEFARSYPAFEGKEINGDIPRTISMSKQTTQSDYQNLNKTKKDYVEVAFSFDLNEQTFCVFAGDECVLLEEKKGKAYPYKFIDKQTGREEVYIPVFQFMGMQGLKGFYNHGILHLLYKISISARSLLNKTALHVDDNSDPINFISVGKNQSDKILQLMEQAAEIRANGGKPVVPLERDFGDSGAISSIALTSASNINEVEYLQNRWDLELKRMGLHLDELESSNVTATQILSEEENANMLIKVMMKLNAPEFEFFLKVVLDLIKTTVSTSDKTPLNLTSNIAVTLENGERVLVKPEDATLGLLSRTLKKRHFFPIVNAESGVIAPKMRAAQIERGLQVAQVGSKAFEDLLGEHAAINGLDLSGADFLAGQQVTPNPLTGGVDGSTIPLDTERMGINPRLSEQKPIF